MRKSIKIAFLTLFIYLFSGCTTDFLETEPTDRLASTGFWKTEADAIAAVNAVYFQFASRDLLRDRLWELANLPTNNILYVDANPLNDLMQRFIWTADSPRFLAAWQGAYRGITMANAVIDRVSGMSIPDATKKRVVAQAKFLRGVFYYILQASFGGVPLVVTEQTAASESQVPRATRAEVLAQVVKDFTEAAADLPVTWDAVNTGRATRGAALAMLVKAHLYQENWTAAVQRSEEILALNRYNLEGNYRELFLTSNENNEESVFEGQFRNTLNGWGESRAGHFLTQNSAPRGAGNQYSPYGGWGNYIPPTNLPAAFEANDERRVATFIMPGETFTPELGGATFTMTAGITRTGMAFTKWWAGVVPNNNDHSHLNLPFIRFAEVLLNYAEALNEVNRTADAYAQINRVRDRAGLDPKPVGTKEACLDDIFRERRTEFVWEFNQWFDLTRRNRFEAHIKTFYPANESATNVRPFHRLFPIPQLEIEANRALTQNEGF